MKERPVPYSAPMVRARRAGIKTMTRRVVNPQPEHKHFGTRHMLALDDEGIELYLHSSTMTRAIRSPYGKPGDRLWVREAYRTLKIHDGLPPRDVPRGAPIWFEADGQAPAEFGRYRHAKFMCRWMSRGLDEVVGVRVERLQDISVADSLAEGVEVHPDHHAKPRASIYSPVQAYRELWESINGPDSWDANPWVWVISFKVL